MPRSSVDRAVVHLHVFAISSHLRETSHTNPPTLQHAHMQVMCSHHHSHITPPGRCARTTCCLHWRLSDGRSQTPLSQKFDCPCRIVFFDLHVI